MSEQATGSTVTRVAVVQAEMAPTLEIGIDRMAVLADEALSHGATLVAFGETFLPGYPAWLDWCPEAALWDHRATKTVYARMARESVDVNGPSGRALADIARTRNITLVTGVVERVADGPGRGTLYNTLLTYGPDGGLLNHHRKLVPTFTERLVWGPGDTAGLRAVDTPGGRVGGLVCWEHWMPHARQALHDSGEDIHVAAWPGAHEMHQIASRHYAFEGRCFVLVCGCLMRAADLPAEFARTDTVADGAHWILRGGSAIVGPDGMYVSQPVFDAPAIILADLPLARVREEQMTLDVSGHYHRPDCFEFRVLPARRPGGDARP